MRISDWSSDVCSSDLDLALRLALDIDGAVLVGEPADERGGPDLRLRHEGRPRRAAEREDIEPAHMIGDEQHVAPKPRAGGADAQARDPAGGVEKGHDHRDRKSTRLNSSH